MTEAQDAELQAMRDDRGQTPRPVSGKSTKRFVKIVIIVKNAFVTLNSPLSGLKAQSRTHTMYILVAKT
jgi:hypothetical protein